MANRADLIEIGKRRPRPGFGEVERELLATFDPEEAGGPIRRILQVG
jgi:hypothetical protein